MKREYELTNEQTDLVEDYIQRLKSGKVARKVKKVEGIFTQKCLDVVRIAHDNIDRVHKRAHEEITDMVDQVMSTATHDFDNDYFLQVMLRGGLVATSLFEYGYGDGSTFIEIDIGGQRIMPDMNSSHRPTMDAKKGQKYNLILIVDPIEEEEKDEDR